MSIRNYPFNPHEILSQRKTRVHDEHSARPHHSSNAGQTLILPYAIDTLHVFLKLVRTINMDDLVVQRYFSTVAALKTYAEAEQPTPDEIVRVRMCFVYAVYYRPWIDACFVDECALDDFRSVLVTLSQRRPIEQASRILRVTICRSSWDRRPLRLSDFEFRPGEMFEMELGGIHIHDDQCCASSVSVDDIMRRAPFH